METLFESICFQEMHDYVTDIEDLYERMSGGKALEPYMNTETLSGLYITSQYICLIK